MLDLLLGRFSFLLCLATLLAGMELGRFVRRRQLARGTPSEEPPGFGVVDGAVFGLMALLLGFSFSGASTRFETRRAQVVEEANAIGTAWLRLDLLPDSTRRPLQAQFRQYLDARIAGYRAMPDTAAAGAAFARAIALQPAIWADAVAATQAAPQSPPAILLLPAINAMFDIASTRLAVMRGHMPELIFQLLLLLVLCCAVLAGYAITDAGPRNWLHILGFATVLAITLLVIVDYEYPRAGRITLSVYDEVMVQLRASMGD
jgi:hypothetical protein